MYRSPYVESSVFIAYIKGEIKDTHDCKAVMDSILSDAEDGRFPIFTSSLTIAEVFKTKRGTPLTEQENLDLRPYFRESYIRLIEVDRDIAERANELCRERASTPGARTLRPNDAIHLASAERAGCEVLLSYDTDLLQQIHGSLRIEWPQSHAQTIQMQLGIGETAVQGNLALPSPEPEFRADDALPEPDVTSQPALKMANEAEAEEATAFVVTEGEHSTAPPAP